jgi:hypothetical protein
MTPPVLADDSCSNLEEKRVKGQAFQFFDGLLHTGKPSLDQYGFKPILIIDRGIWPTGSSHNSPPDPALVKGIMEKAPRDGTPVMLDFEGFPLTGTKAVVGESIEKLSAIVKAFKTAAPDRDYGFYSVLPLRDYWRAVSGVGTAKYRQWQAENDGVRSIEPKIQALFPPLYTFYNDRNGWVEFAKAQICEARRLSRKPVHVLIWPEYHDSSKLRNTAIDPDFWKLQLETSLKYADGVIIWGGYDFIKKQRSPWDENASWWRATQEFLSKKR